MLKTLPALAALAAAGALLTPTISQAADTDSVRVSYADLNLASDSGQSALQGRIAVAAETVCGPADHRDVPFTQRVRECRSGTIADAQPAYQAAINAARHGTVEVLSGAALVITAH
nr:UrcA family protein [Sphingomonas sp.]